MRPAPGFGLWDLKANRLVKECGLEGIATTDKSQVVVVVAQRRDALCGPRRWGCVVWDVKAEKVRFPIPAPASQDFETQPGQPTAAYLPC